MTVTSGVRVGDEGTRGAGATVFVSDPTAEAERVAQALRAGGYTVVDVPLSMLVARVAVQHPRVILVDADGEGALDAVARVRELPDAEGIDVLFIAREGSAMATNEDALAHEGSGLFTRPVDVPALVRKVDALTGGAAPASPPRASVPPPASVPGSQPKRPSVPPALPPASMRAVAAVAASEVLPAGAPGSKPPALRSSRIPSEPPTSAGTPSRRVPALAPPVSPELQQMLVDAEQRVSVQQGESDSIVPSPEDEIEAVLPAELLASLDEPMEEDDDEDEVAVATRSPTSSAATRERTSDGGGSRTTGATGAGSTPTTGTATRSAAATAGVRAGGTGEAELTPPPAQTHGGTHSGGTGAGVSTTGGSERRDLSAASPAPAPVLPALTPAPVDPAPDVPRRPSTAPPPTAWSNDPPPPPPEALRGAVPAMGDAPFPSVLGPGDATRVVARAIAARTTASLCVASSEAERRVVLREGDVVTAASTAEDESLLAFLRVRGELPRETVHRLASKFAPFGRHAGAALVARGYLRQDQMWPMLRAHAEWVLSRILATSGARLLIEVQPPGRLAGEPSVFGGSTGAAVFVEVVRRVVPQAEAIDRLGGVGSRIGDGASSQLLGECALGAAELDVLGSSEGRSLRELIDAAPESDLPTVVFALAELGVVEVMRAIGGDAGHATGNGASGAPDAAAMDADAIRARVRARLQLVEDGDYFAVLGVGREATGYEVRRAFVELRRAFEPSRLLTPEVADLADEVRKIVSVIEEAYEILKDSARRERYRRAIEGSPG